MPHLQVECSSASDMGGAHRRAAHDGSGRVTPERSARDVAAGRKKCQAPSNVGEACQAVVLSGSANSDS
jgi:hypothetical protein